MKKIILVLIVLSVSHAHAFTCTSKLERAIKKDYPALQGCDYSHEDDGRWFFDCAFNKPDGHGMSCTSFSIETSFIPSRCDTGTIRSESRCRP